LDYSESTQEIDTLIDAWFSAKEGNPQFVVLEENSASKKTQIAYEFFSHLKNHEDYTGYWDGTTFPKTTEEKSNPINHPPSSFPPDEAPSIPWLWWELSWNEKSFNHLDDGINDALDELFIHFDWIIKHDLKFHFYTTIRKHFHDIGTVCAKIIGLEFLEKLATKDSLAEQILSELKNSNLKIEFPSPEASINKTTVEHLVQFFKVVLEMHSIALGQSPLPTVIFLNNVQWIDEAGLELIERLTVEATNNNWPLLIITTHLTPDQTSKATKLKTFTSLVQQQKVQSPCITWKRLGFSDNLPQGANSESKKSKTERSEIPNLEQIQQSLADYQSHNSLKNSERSKLRQRILQQIDAIEPSNLTDPQISTLIRVHSEEAKLAELSSKFSVAEQLLRAGLKLTQHTYLNHYTHKTELLEQFAALKAAQDPQSKLAQALYKRAISIQDRQLPDQIKERASTLNNYAKTLSRLKYYNQAFSLHQEALRLQQEHFGHTHPETFRSHNELALINYQQGFYTKAIVNYFEIISIKNDPANLAESYFEEAYLYANMIDEILKLDENYLSGSARS
jgi:hypothetical protein